MFISKDLVAASASPMVLGILADGDTYGYAIVKRVRELSGGDIEWTDGLLYPLLHRLEDAGHVRSTWVSSESGPRRKYYSITDDGRAALGEHQRQWRTVTAALKSTWGDATTVVEHSLARPEGRLAW